MSETFIGHTSNPYNRTGRHFALIKCLPVLLYGLSRLKFTNPNQSNIRTQLNNKDGECSKITES